MNIALKNLLSTPSLEGLSLILAAVAEHGCRPLCRKVVSSCFVPLQRSTLHCPAFSADNSMLYCIVPVLLPFQSSGGNSSECYTHQQIPQQFSHQRSAMIANAIHKLTSSSSVVCGEGHYPHNHITVYLLQMLLHNGCYRPPRSLPLSPIDIAGILPWSSSTRVFQCGDLFPLASFTIPYKNLRSIKHRFLPKIGTFFQLCRYDNPSGTKASRACQ